MGKEKTEAKYGNAFTSALIACALFCAMVPSAHSAEVSKDDAWVAVANFVYLKETLDENAFSEKQAGDVSTFKGADGYCKCYVVSLTGGGYVVTSADTRIAPILAYSSEGDFVADEGNQLYRLLVRDVAGRVKMLGTGNGLPTEASAKAGEQWSRNTNEWARLKAGLPVAYGAVDLRVAPLCSAEPVVTDGIVGTNTVIAKGGCFSDECRAMLPGFDLGLPCGIRIAADSRFLGDGYGYSAGRLHIHLNFGPSAAWYVPAEDDERDAETPAILGVEYNIYTVYSLDELGRTAVGGRVFGEDGDSLSGRTVTATNRKTGETFAATSGEKGIFAFKLPPNVTYVLSVEEDGSSARAVLRVGECISDAVVANVHGVELRLSSGPSEEAWLDESAATSQLTGEWSCEMEYGEDGKSIIDVYDGEIAFTPFSASTGDRATVKVVAQFKACEEDITPDATTQSAVRLGTNGCFQVWTRLRQGYGGQAGWVDVAAEGLTPVKGEEYSLEFTFDYAAQTYSVKTGGSRFRATDGTENFPLACSTSCLTSIAFKGETLFTSLYGECVMVATGFEKDDVVYLKDNAQAVLDAARAAWLNKCADGDKSAVETAAEALTEAEFNDAYLLNVDVAGDRSYTFKITGVDVTASEVVIDVELMRPGKLEQPINGVLKFYGAQTLAEFKAGTAEPVASTTIVDDDFSEGDTATATIQLEGETPPAFFNAKIDERAE